MVYVEPQVFGVLAYLLEHHDRVVATTEPLDNRAGSMSVTERVGTGRIVVRADGWRSPRRQRRGRRLL